MVRDARLSECGTFRWWLSRTWDASLPVLLFVMLNPSKADASVDDPTVRKCIGFAQRNGYGSIVVVNLFAYRATDPADLKAGGWQQGEDNAVLVCDMARQYVHDGGRVVVAWGANARGRPEARSMLSSLRGYGVPLYALRVLGDGTPAHPLMLPYSCELVPFGVPA